MRKRVICAVLAGVLLLAAGCAPQGAGAARHNEQWLAGAGLDAQETPEQLYRAALDEDTLIIYSNSTRMLDVKKTFEAAYPGLVVEVTDMRGSDMLDLLIEAHGRGEPLCDLMVCADNNGAITREMIPEGVVVKYVPWDIEDKLLPANNQEDLAFFNEGTVLYYNSEKYREPPVSNWWELTEPRFYGKIVTSSPQKSLSMYAFFSTLIQNSEAMAESYLEHFGEPLPHPEDAGWEFIDRLLKNGVVFVNSAEEIANAVGAPDLEDPALGIMISSKVRMNDIGYALAPHYEMEPFAGALSTNSIMLVSGAENVNAAKLFVRWLLGEADGTGEGYHPYLQMGEWPARTDIESSEPVPLAQIDLRAPDKEYLYSNRESFNQRWKELLEAAGG
ncbi:extracellular solute-binding protein [Ruminococcaceae bacterium OttesenSCG-928-D13]|nr:extracellular solute-binding protein [Ruminococcaceae bacterium OttesenSCG-928-D13]